MKGHSTPIPFTATLFIRLWALEYTGTAAVAAGFADVRAVVIVQPDSLPEIGAHFGANATPDPIPGDAAVSINDCDADPGRFRINRLQCAG